jgi:hypothetical protein
LSIWSDCLRYNDQDASRLLVVRLSGDAVDRCRETSEEPVLMEVPG